MAAKMTNIEFVQRLLGLTASNIKTLYVSGGFGVNIGYSGNKEWYINNYEFNSRPNSTKSSPERKSKIQSAAMGTFGFDCVGMVKGILFYGWNGYRSASAESTDITAPKGPWDSMTDYERKCRYGGATWKSSYDFTIEALLARCTNVKEVPNVYSNSLSKLDNEICIGEFLTGTGNNSTVYDKNNQGHCGIYIGNGLSIETTYSGTDGVQLAYMNVNDRENLKNAKFRIRDSRWWKFHGRLSEWVDYTYDNDTYKAYEDYLEDIIKTGNISAYYTNINTDAAQNSSKKAVDNAAATVTDTQYAPSPNYDSRGYELNNEIINDELVPLSGDDYTNIANEVLNAWNNTETKLNERLTLFTSDTNFDANRYYEEEVYQRKIRGIEGIPYQYMPDVDIRPDGTMDALGIKYAEKILNNAPLLYLIPCVPKFLNLRNRDDRTKILGAISGALSAEDLTDLLSDSGGRYYISKFAHAQYYNYLNPMLAAIARFLGIDGVKIPIGPDGDVAIGSVAWQYELTNKDWKFNYNGLSTGKETLLFYLDGLNSVDESFGNDTTQSSVVGMINGISDQARELITLSQGGNSGVLSGLKDKISEIFGTSDGENTVLSPNIANSLGGAFNSLLDASGLGALGALVGDGITTINNGGKIVFPDIWSDSRYDKSYSLQFKFRSPDHDPVSIFLNVIKPYCKLLALVLPHMLDSDNGVTAGYTSPFLVKAYCKGIFNIDYGLITGMSVSKGAESCWTDDGLPTQIDVSIDITDLYHAMSMSGYGNENDGVIKSIIKDFTQASPDTIKFVKNTAYMDFLANMAGLNIADMAPGRAVSMYKYLIKHRVDTMIPTIQVQIEQIFQRAVGAIFGKLN